MERYTDEERTQRYEFITCYRRFSYFRGESECIFKRGKLKRFREGFQEAQGKLAELNELEILNCSFKAFRTFYVTKRSYKFNNPFEAQYRAKMSTTQAHPTVTNTIEEECEVVKQGFQYVTDVEDVKLWQKPK